VKEQNDNSQFTPDWWNISQFRRQLYFAYGEDMPERRDHSNIFGEAKVQRCGPAYTALPLSVYIHKDGADHTFPVALEEQFKYTSPFTPYVTLKGELLAIPPETIRTLDTYHENRSIFIRKRISVIVPMVDRRFSEYGVTPTEGIGLAPAWAYFGMSEYWNDRLDCGYQFEPAPRFDNLFVKEYYFYGTYDFSPD